MRQVWRRANCKTNLERERARAREEERGREGGRWARERARNIRRAILLAWNTVATRAHGRSLFGGLTSVATLSRRCWWSRCILSSVLRQTSRIHKLPSTFFVFVSTSYYFRLVICFAFTLFRIFMICVRNVIVCVCTCGSL